MTMYLGGDFMLVILANSCATVLLMMLNVKYFREQPGGHNEFEAEKN